jgi:anti-anti-sigma regulatory factor
MATADEFRHRLEADVTSSVGDVVLDFVQLRFIDSCELGVLINSRSRRARRAVAFT